jgi:beta-lactamase regulating signal transducer with metallopeptidase domain
VDDVLDTALSNAVAAAVLAVVAAAVGWVCRRPALRHGLCLLVLLKLVTPPLVRVPVLWLAEPQPALSDSGTPSEATTNAAPPAAADWPVLAPPNPGEQDIPFAVAPAALTPGGVDAPAEDVPGAENVPPTDPSWRRVVPVVWLAGSSAWLALAVLRLGRFHRLLRHARPAPADLQERTCRLARRLGLSRVPAVVLLPGRLPPMLWAVGGRPRLLLPAPLLGRLGASGLDTLLVHELAHLRRRDHWVRGLEFMALALYWWHPAVWYARRELREAEEQCCDAWVVSTLPGAGRTYAAALLDTLDFLSAPPAVVPPLASGLGPVPDLKRRLTMIMRGTTPRALSWPGRLAVLAVAALSFPLLPALQAQTPADRDRKEDTRDAHKKVVEDVIIVQTDDKAAADLKKLEAELEATKAEMARAAADLKARAAALAQAKARLEAVAQARTLAAKKAAIQKDSARAKLQEAGRKDTTAAGGKGVIRIEIHFSPDDKAADVKEVIRKVQKALGDVNAKVIISTRDDRPAAGATGPKAPVWAQPANEKEPPHKRPAGAPEQRINELEKKLEKVMQELQDLRKEMKTRPQAGQGSNKRPGVLYDGRLAK